jgi:hypothetical protein
MARALLKLSAVSHALGVSGIPDANTGTSNVFLCSVASSGEQVPIIFDSAINEPLTSILLDGARFYFDKLVSTRVIPVGTTMGSTDISASVDRCLFEQSSKEVPITLIQMPDVGLDFAVASSGPGSQLFNENDILSTIRLEGSDSIETIIVGSGAQVDDSFACRNNNEDRMIMKRVSDELWEFGLDSIGLLTRGANYSHLTKSVQKAIVATAFEGIALPAVQYDEMISILESSGLALGSGDSKVVSNCFTDDGISKSLPDLVISFSGQDGYGVRIQPADYVLKLDNGECRLLIQKVASSELVLGDAFIKSGYVELNKVEKFMVACPNHQYHVTDDAFNPNIPAHSRPAPRGVSRAPSPQNGVVTVGELQEKDTSNNALVIGLTVGGVVLIIAAIVFFIVRKRMQAKRVVSRFDPSRSMIHEPSEVSSVDSIAPAARV